MRGVGASAGSAAGLCLAPTHQLRLPEDSPARDQFLQNGQTVAEQGQSLARTLFQDRAGLEMLLRELWRKILKLARKEHQPSRPTTWQNLCTHWLDPAPT